MAVGGVMDFPLPVPNSLEITSPVNPSEFHMSSGAGHARAYVRVCCVAALIGVATLGLGFFSDDFLHLATIDGRDTPAHSKWNLFTFADGNPAHMRHQQSTGPHPWFALPALKMHFFRPLTSATMVIDRAVFGDWAPGYHLHSALWYLALVAVVMLLFRSWLPGGAGVLALLLFTIDEAHAIPLGWWANRNALVATVPALLGLLAHLRWRERGWRPGLPLSLVGYIVGFLGGEIALGVMGYLGAYELIAAPGPWRKRFTALLPAATLSLVYLYLYGLAGFGAYGSRDYINPLRETGVFLAHFPDRFLGMVGNLFLSFPPEGHVLLSRLQWGLVAVAIMVPALLLLRSRMSAEERRALPWLLLGGLIAGIPTLGAAPSARLYMLPSIAAAAVIAVVLRHTWAMAWSRRNVLWKTLLLLFGFFHLLLAGLFWPLALVAISLLTSGHAASARSFESRCDIAGKEVILLTAPDLLYTVYFPFQLSKDRLPAAWWANTLSPYDKRITRTAPNELEVELIGDDVLPRGIEHVLRSTRFPFVKGDEVAVTGMTVRVLETENGGVRKFRMTFDASLNDARYRFLVYDASLPGFTFTSPPALGEHVDLERQYLPSLF